MRDAVLAWACPRLLCLVNLERLPPGLEALLKLARSEGSISYTYIKAVFKTTGTGLSSTSPLPDRWDKEQWIRHDWVHQAS